MPGFMHWAIQALLLWPAHAQLQNFAVVRPFAIADAPLLPSSFDLWNVHLPCQKGTSVPVDLVLSFSQNVAINAEALQATQLLSDQYIASRTLNNTWHHCFRSLQIVSALLSPEDDVYQPSQFMQNPDWVRGPNMHFLRMEQAFETKAWGDYDAWYLMEMDSVPRLDGWLDALLSEVADRAPIGVLGSFYRGDSWDGMTLPEEMALHINGNAVYNSSNPMMRSFTIDLAVKMASNVVTPAFDVLLAAHYLAQELTAEQFSWFDGNSSVIGNYAHTAMIADYYNGEAIVHGGTLYEAWPVQTESVALVVSDFGLTDETGQPALKTFQQKLLAGSHPFREVVVMRPSINEARYQALINGAAGVESVVFTETAREESAWLDWCNANVSSPWFVYTNTFFDFGRRVDLMRGANHTPLIIYTDANSSFCSDHINCLDAVRHASEFVGQQLLEHIDVHDMVFHTASRDLFCAEWKNWSTIRRAGPKHIIDPIYGPSADDFIAWVKKNGKGPKFCWKNEKEHPRRPHGMANATVCQAQPTREACRAIKFCHWHPRFETCFFGGPPMNKKPPRFNITHRYNDTCAPNRVHPKIHIDSMEAIPVEFLVEFSGPFSSTTSAIQVNSLSSAALDVGSLASTQPVNDVISGTMTLRTNNMFPRLVDVIPIEAYDLTAWSVAASYTYDTMAITTSQPTVLLADQPVKSATATELVLDAVSLLKQGTKKVHVEQNGDRGQKKVHLKKCHDVTVAVVTGTATPTTTVTPTATRRPKMRTLSVTPTSTGTATATATWTATPTRIAVPPVAPKASPLRSSSPLASQSKSPLSTPSARPVSAQPSASRQASPSRSASPSRRASPQRTPSASPKMAIASPQPSASPQLVASPLASASPKPVTSAQPSRSPAAVQASPARSPSPKAARKGKDIDTTFGETAVEQFSAATSSSVPWIVIGVMLPVVLILAAFGWLFVRQHRRNGHLMHELALTEVTAAGAPSMMDPNCTPVAMAISPEGPGCADLDAANALGAEETPKVQECI